MPGAHGRQPVIIAAQMCATRRSSTAPNDDPAPAAESQYAGPSKSQRKRDSHALQALGVRLIELRDDILVRLPLSEDLIEAIRTARGIRSHEGKRRQVQLVGKLMRMADGEAIRAALSDETREHRVSTAVMHAAERWRERILADDRVLANWIGEFPETREQVEQLVPRARKELAAKAPGRAFRELFRTVRGRLEEQAASAAAGPTAAGSKATGQDAAGEKTSGA
jgi:ribosome-associated protein